jgi:BASS family bile acid:Na+ symporter
MDFKQLVILALQISIFCTVFRFGLRTEAADLLYVVRRPGLLARSLLSIFVIMPIVTVAFLRLFDFPRAVEVVLVALAISPVPPLLPMKETKAGGHTTYALGLMAILALVAIVAIPLALELLQRIYRRELGIAYGAIAVLVVQSVLAPLLAGLVLRAALPALAKRLERPVRLIANVLLPVAVVALVAGTLPAMWALIGDGTVVAIVMVTFAGLAIGHVLGGPNPDHSVVLALSTASRHPAIALAIASADFPNVQFGPIVLLCLLVNALAVIPYIKWQTRPTARAVRTA